MKIYELIQQGGPVMYPLLACSVIAMTVICERLFFWRHIRRRRNRQLMDRVLRLAETASWQEIKEITKNCEDHVIKVLAVGILHRDYDMSKAMEAEAQHIAKKMSQFMTVLDTMITVTPLLGILGTVLGIISSFDVLGASGLADPKLVTGGIAQALVTTAAGLSISITCVFPYNYFRSRIANAVHVMEKYATSLEVVYNKLSADQSDED